MLPIREIVQNFVRFRERTAMVAEGYSFTYVELARRIAQVSEILERHAEDGSAFTVLYETIDSPWTYAVMLSATSKGHAFVPFDPLVTRRRIDLLGVTRPRVAFLSKETADTVLRIPALGVSHVYIYGNAAPVLAVAAAPPKEASQSSRGDPEIPRDTLYMLSTSGSTGLPKIVPITASNFDAFLRHIDRTYEFSADDRFSHTFRQTFDLSMFDLFVPWRMGATVFKMGRFALMDAGTFVASNRLSVWFSVPTAAATYLRRSHRARGSLASLRYSLFCGEALRVDVARRWRALAPQSRMMNLYGPTECTVACTEFEIGTDEELRRLPMSVIPIGDAFSDVLLHILSPDQNSGPAELCIGGLQVLKHYLGGSPKAECFHTRADGQRFYRTGDLVTRHPSYGLLFEGRNDDQVKCNGFRISLCEVESLAQNELNEGQTGAVALDSEHGTKLVLFVTGTRSSEVSVMASLARSLPRHLQPHRVILFPGDLPTTANGKLDRTALKQYAHEN